MMKNIFKEKDRKKLVCNKDWGLESNTNLNSIFCLIKSSGIVFIFLPAFCLIIWLMAFPKNFEKIAILEIGQLVFHKAIALGFPMRCQNLLRRILPKMMRFQAWKNLILTNNVI